MRRLLVEIGGDKGTLLINGKSVRLSLRDESREIPGSEMPEDLPKPLEIWALSQKDDDIPDHLGIDAAVRLTQIMEMAYRDAKSNI